MTMSRKDLLERRKNIASDVMNGICSLSGASVKYSVSPTTVRYACKTFRIDLEKAKKIIAVKVSSAIRDGFPKDEVAKEFMISLSFIKRACIQNDVIFEPLGPKTDVSLKILADLMNSTEPLVEISYRHNVSPKIVGRLYKMAIGAGLSINKRHQGLGREPQFRIGISFERGIILNWEFFSSFTNRFIGIADIFIFSKREGIEEILKETGIDWTVIITTDDIEKEVIVRKIDIMFDDLGGDIFLQSNDLYNKAIL